MLVAFGFSVLANKVNVAVRPATCTATILARPTFLLQFPNAQCYRICICQYHRSTAAGKRKRYVHIVSTSYILFFVVHSLFLPSISLPLMNIYI